MKHIKRLLSFLLALVLVLQCSAFAVSNGEEDGQWVRAWSTSMVEATVSELASLAGTDSTASKILRMIAFNLAMGVSSASCRMNIQPTMSGDQIRLTLSNEHGTSDVKIQAMTVARSNAQNLDRIVASTAVDVTVNGSTEIVIPAGARIVTDPIDFPVEALEHISVTMYIDQFSTVNTVGLIGGDSYLYFGDMTTQTAAGLGLYMNYIENSGEYSVIPMLCGVDVYRTDNASACVIIGDSTVANDVPILLEEKLQNTGIDNVSVLQAAIKGNELLNNGQGALGRLLGQACKDRFLADAVQQPGVKYIIVKIGINDIIHPACTSLASNYTNLDLSNQAFFNAYQKMIDTAHRYGKQIYFYSLGAWEGYTRNILNKGDDVACTASLEKKRNEINQWLSQCGADGFFDTSPMNDPNNPSKQLSSYTTDGAHLTASGQQALIDLIPLGIFDGFCVHDFVTDEAVAVTCTTDGKTEGSHCSKCGYVNRVQETIPATGHKYGDSVITKAATCTETGIRTRSCQMCGTSVQTDIPAKGHDFRVVSSKAASCTEAGYTDSVCATCNLTKHTELPMLDHSWDAGVVTTPPTETTTGIRTYTCTRCSTVKNELIPALSHVHTYVLNTALPTCTEQGCTTHTCTGCGDTYVDNYVPALGHTWDSGVVTTPATETANGVRTYTCTRCTETKTELIPKLTHTHTYTSAVTPPTCTNQGYTTHTCTGCSDTYVDAYVPALGHSWDGGVVTTAATATTDGVKTYTCTRCGETRTESIPATGNTTGTHVCPGAIFSDMPKYSNWAHAGIDYCVENGLMSGMGNGKFEPDTATSRAMVVAILWRQAGMKAPSAPAPFTDLTQDWYKDAVAWAAENGIVAGRSATIFDPDAPISRQEMASILYRYTQNYLKLNMSKTANISTFPDYNKVSSYARTAMAWANAQGLISGTAENGIVYLDPLGNATRAQTARILMVFCEVVANSK